LPHQGIGGVAAFEDFVVVSSRDRNDAMDVFSCLDPSTGIMYWQSTYGATGNLDYGNSPRATPLILDPYVVTLGAFGDLQCLDMISGAIVWKKHLVKDFQGELPQWGYSASPIVVDEKLIIQPGGQAKSIVALELSTGKLLWATPGRVPAYASLVPNRVGTRWQVIGFDDKSAGAWSVADGARDWELIAPIKNDFNVPTPVLAPEGLLLTSENNGTRFYRWTESGGVESEPSAQTEDLAGDSHSPIRIGKLLIGVDHSLQMLDWTDGLRCVAKQEDRAFRGYCSLIGSEDRVLVVCENSEVLLYQLEERQFRELGRVRVADADTQILSHPAISGRTLFVRLPNALVAWELSPESAP
jgi:outer membrane protein assembly factor BamB